jgi:uncharacterized protein (DUF1697 family)
MKYAAFLRGINVGGHRVTNLELRSLLEGIGLTEVDTFRASGNLVFTADSRARAGLAGGIERELAGSLGYDVATFLRSAGEVRAIAVLEPFASDAVRASAGKLQVSLLSQPPAPAAREAVLSLASGEDLLALGARELYWLPSGRTTDSALDLKLIERTLGPMTMRTKNTVEQLAGRHFAA